MKNFLAKYFISPSAVNEFILFLITGLFWCLSFPPFKFSFLSWFMLVPFFFMLNRENQNKIIIGKTYLFLLISHVLTLYWICFSTVMGGVLAILVNPLFMMFPIFIWLFFRKKIASEFIQLLVLALLWIAFEWLLSLWELAFPWMILGNTQFLFSVELQFASVGGVFLISFFVFLFNIIFYFILKEWILSEKPHVKNWLFSLGFLFIFILFAGFFLTTQTEHPIGKLTAGIIQPNIDPWEKWDSDNEANQVDQMENQTRKLAVQDSTLRLVIWPETAVPFYLLEGSDNVFRNSLVRLSNEKNLAIATGFPHLQIYDDSTFAPPSARYSDWRKKYYQHFNAATVIDKNNIPVAYGKICLVPFAERVPWIDAYPFMKDLRFNLAGLGGWGKGLDTINFKLSSDADAIFPTAICYESAFPDLIKSFTQKGATFLTIITNDGWWGNTSGYHQHFEFSRMRAIENHRWIVRSANNGISGFIDPKGNVIEQTEYWKQTELSHQIELYDSETLYVKFGNWFPKLCLILSAVLVGWSFFKK